MSQYLAARIGAVSSFPNPFSNAVLRWPGHRELQQVKCLQFLAREPAQQFAPRTPARFQFLPKSLVRVKLVHPALRPSLLRRKIVIRIHQPFLFLPRFLLAAAAPDSSASIASTVGRLPLRFLGNDSTNFVCHSATPIGFLTSRNAYSTISRSFSLQSSKPIVG